MRAVTIADVAARAGVSASTASRALSASRPVGHQTERRVRRAAEELGYAGNSIARALRVKRTDTVGMVVPSILNPFFTALVDSVEETLHTQNRQLFLCDSRQDPTIEAEHLRSLIQRNVDGIIVSPCHQTDSRATITRSAARIPLVQLDRRIDVPGTDWVGLDDDEAMRLIVTHLHERGARSMAFVTSEMTNSSTGLRLAGFRRYTEQFSICTRPDWILLREYAVEAGLDAGRQLLSGDERPDAVVCADDLIAIGVLAACRDIGVAVPEQVQVTGFDDINFAKYVTPPLTTLVQPTDRMAEEALRLLARKVDGATTGGSGSGVRLALGPSLIVRDSTRTATTS